MVVNGLCETCRNKVKVLFCWVEFIVPPQGKRSEGAEPLAAGFDDLGASKLGVLCYYWFFV